MIDNYQLSPKWELELALDLQQWTLGFNWFRPLDTMLCGNLFLGPFRIGVTRS